MSHDHIQEIDLVIIAKTIFKSGYCYLAQGDDVGVVRPIKRFRSHWDNACCWESSRYRFEVNDIVRFKVRTNLMGKIITGNPHANNDLFVLERAVKIGESSISLGVRLEPYLSGNDFENLFHPFGYLRHSSLMHHVFVKDGTPCKSVGIYKTNRQNMFPKYQEGKRPRILLKENNKWFNLPWTGVEPLNQVTAQLEGDDDLLLIVGFARAYMVDRCRQMHYCMLLAIGWAKCRS